MKAEQNESPIHALAFLPYCIQIPVLMGFLLGQPQKDVWSFKAGSWGLGLLVFLGGQWILAVPASSFHGFCLEPETSSFMEAAE